MVQKDSKLEEEIKKQEIYIIPGFGETIKDDPYPILSNILKDKGYLVKNYQPKWRYRTITQWLKDFGDLLLNDKNSKPIVLGFSLGANIAILKARDFNFSKIILCSPAPFFKEDLKKVSPIAQKILGNKRINEFKKNEFPSHLKTPCIFISGSLESLF